jgi:hypothetical protein
MRHSKYVLLALPVIAFYLGATSWPQPGASAAEFPVIERAANDSVRSWHIYRDEKLQFSIRYPDGILARPLPSPGGVEFIREQDERAEIVPVRLEIAPAGPRGADPTILLQ